MTAMAPMTAMACMSDTCCEIEALHSSTCNYCRIIRIAKVTIYCLTHTGPSSRGWEINITDNTIIYRCRAIYIDIIMSWIIYIIPTTPIGFPITVRIWRPIWMEVAICRSRSGDIHRWCSASDNTCTDSCIHITYWSAGCISTWKHSSETNHSKTHF